MTFYEYILEHIETEEEFDAIIGGAEMPATFGFNDDWVITDYCKKKYKELLNSEVEIIDEDNIEVLYDDADVGEAFCLAVAGYISETEWDKLFKE